MENPVKTIITELKGALDEHTDRIIEAVGLRGVAPGLDFRNYISLKQAAEELGIASQTLWSHKTRIGYTKQFGQIYFKRQDLVDYIESGRPVPESRIKFTKYTRRKSGE